MVSPNLRDFSEILFFDHLKGGASFYGQIAMKINEFKDNPKNVTTLRKH